MSQHRLLFLIPLLVSIQCFAQINVSTDSGCSPLLNVSFTYSDPALSNPVWEFGDGTQSFAQAPIHSFLNAGEFWVVLNGTVNGQPIIDSTMITVFANPAANFYIDGNYMGCLPLTVSFVDVSMASASAPIVSHSWTFGDGTYADTNLTQFNHIYYGMGAYNVSLQVTDTNGCQDFVLHDSIAFASSPPVVEFSNNLDSLTNCSAPFFVEFYASAESPFSAVNDFDFYWDFNNGLFATTANAVSEFTPGTYNCNLQVTDNYMCASNHPFPLTIIIPEASFEISNSVDSIICDTAFLTNTSNVSTVWWDYGDGTVDTSSSHIYSFPGTYQVQMFANYGNCTDDTIVSLVVEDVQAGYTLTPDYTCSTPFGVQYTDTSINANEWLWLFPGYATDTAQNPYMVYNDPDSSICEQVQQYSIHPTLIVTSAHGCQDTLLNGPDVEFDMPISRFLPDVSWGMAPLTVLFSDSSYMPDSTISWHWDFGDGIDTLVTFDTISHTFDLPGLYDVVLTIENDSGCTDIAYPVTISVYDSAEYLQDFLPVSMDVCPCFPYCDSVSPTYLTAYNHLMQRMNFDSINPPPISNFTNDTGLVVFTRRENVGGQILIDTIFQPEIRVLGPLANIDYAINCDSLYQFSFFANTTDADSLSWDFGDGTVSDSLTTDTVIHSYAQSGMYLVTLQAFNESTGCTYIDSLIVTASKPVASFNFPDEVCAYESVTFDASASVDVYSHCHNGYQWNFGDTTSLINTAEDSTVHRYIAGGEYYIELTVSDINACTHSIKDTINVFEVHADFSFYPINICVPGSTDFWDSSTGDTTLVSWHIDYGDGNSDPFFPTSHSYTMLTNDFLNVQLTVTDTLGCTDKAVRQVGLFYPQADIVASDSSFCAGNYILLEVDPFFSYVDWDFGDGTTNDGNQVHHTYNTPGQYTVSAAVVDAAGCQDTTTYVNFIEVYELPDASFISDPPVDTVCLPVQIDFSDVSLVDTLAWRHWSMDGGSSINPDSVISFAFDMPGSYHLNLTVANNHGCTDSYADSFVIQGPVLDFASDTNVICHGGQVTFTVSDTFNVDGWMIDFGDGVIDSSQSLVVTHYYNPNFAPTDNQVMVSFQYWSSGCDVVDSIPLNFYPKVDADFILLNWHDSVICLGDPINIDNLTVNGTLWHWDFGNGAVSTSENINNYTYPNSGNYEISLIASSGFGCSDTLTSDVLVTGVYPDLIASSDVICHEGFAFFADSSMADAGIASWHIDFGDGDTSNQVPSSHYFSSPPLGSNFAVELSITDNFGCTESDIELVPFSDPVANFTVSNPHPCLHDTVNFSSYSSFADYFWQFGTGDTSTDATPQYPYSQTGQYSVSLIIEDHLGCTDTVSYTDFVEVHEIPVAAFHFTPNTSPQCAPVTVEFTDISTCPDNFTIEWTYPGGTSSSSPLEITWELPGTNQIALTTTSQYGCKDSSSTVIEVEKPMADLLIENPEICFGETVSFTLENPSSVISSDWNFGDGSTLLGHNGYQLTHTYSNLPTGGGNLYQFSLQLYSQNCTTTVEEEIEIFLPVSDFTVQNPACAGEPLQFTNTSQLANQYLWVFGTGDNSTEESPTFTFDNNGTYNVILQVSYQPLGCTDASAEILTVLDPDLTFLFPPDSICLGQNINFGISSLVDVAGWQIDFGDGNTEQGSVMANVNHTYPYGMSNNGTIPINVLFWSNNNVCVDEINETLLVHKVSAKIGSSTDPDFVMCHGEQIVFLDQSINSDFNTWDFGNGNGETNNDTPSQVYTAPGQYDVTLHINDTESGCDDYATQTITVRDDAKISNLDFYSCDGDPVILDIVVDGGATFYQWTPSDSLSDANAAAPTANISVPTEFQVSLVDNFGCSGTASVWVDYIVPPIEVNEEDTVIIGDTAYLQTHFNPDYTLVWGNNGDLSCDSCPDPWAFTLQSTTYEVTVSDPGGCFDKVSTFHVEVREEDKMSMPTVFTPNGDGLNDEFMPYGWGMKKLIEFKVFNRWGDMVYQSDDISKGWDGTYKGKNQAPDTYIYLIKVEMWLDNKIKEEQGYVNLIR